jgi:5-methylcytosine-specific restriction endonuclease McrA
MRYCLEPRCGEIVEGRSYYCAPHTKKVEPWKGSKSQSKTWEARRVRPRVLRRDNYRCVWFDEGHRCTALATEVDAIVPSAEGGSHTDLTNLQSLCREHHKIKTEQDRRRGLERSRTKKGGSPK